ncbi:MAG: DNA alkylation repair protein [Lachnospiraceae bacterium]|nr:DNA alkylation repair protein [Lachnospiraceae bacterium]
MGNKSIIDEIRDELFSLQDIKYRDFQAKLIPTVSADSVIGVRTPELRKLAKKELKKDNIGDFLDTLPHEYFDEKQLHAFVISEIKDYDECIKRLEKFLPYIDNWATCDQLSPKVFKKHKSKLLSKIREWIASKKTYTVRFAIGMLMQHYLDEDFDIEYPEMVSKVRSEEYYVNMMIAWYFATALAKQYEVVLPFIEGKRLSDWTHNKVIQKSIESYRISSEQKEYLKKLKVAKN